MMRNIILDTNAFTYLTNYERQIPNRICIEGKYQIQDKKFHDYCINANHLFVTGQTLYELFWQSIEHTGDIHEFAFLYDLIGKYKRIYGVKFSVLNDIEGMFNLKLFQEQYRNKKVDIEWFVEEKRKCEIKKLERILNTLYTSAMGMIVDYCQVQLTPDFLNWVSNAIEKSLDNVSKLYYAVPGTKNERYDLAIEQILERLWTLSVDMCKAGAETLGIAVPNARRGEGGTVFMHRLFCNMKPQKRNIMSEYGEYLDEIGERLRSRGEYDESIEYLKSICKRSICDGAKIKKNDGLDFSIITCLAKDNILNETGHSIDLRNTYAITFDRNLYNFTKKNNILYNKEIYDELLVKE